MFRPSKKNPSRGAVPLKIKFGILSHICGMARASVLTFQASGTTSGWGNLGRWPTFTGIPSTDPQVPLYTVITLTFSYLYSFRTESEVLWNAYII